MMMQDEPPKWTKPDDWTKPWPPEYPATDWPRLRKESALRHEVVAAVKLLIDALLPEDQAEVLRHITAARPESTDAVSQEAQDMRPYHVIMMKRGNPTAAYLVRWEPPVYSFAPSRSRAVAFKGHEAAAAAIQLRAQQYDPEITYARILGDVRGSIEPATTERGLKLGNFKDRYGVECSIQESSIATEASIWLGRDGGGTHGSTRMHLDQRLAGELAEILQHFADTGELRLRGEAPDDAVS